MQILGMAQQIAKENRFTRFVIAPALVKHLPLIELVHRAGIGLVIPAGIDDEANIWVALDQRIQPHAKSLGIMETARHLMIDQHHRNLGKHLFQLVQKPLGGLVVKLVKVAKVDAIGLLPVRMRFHIGVSLPILRLHQQPALINLRIFKQPNQLFSKRIISNNPKKKNPGHLQRKEVHHHIARSTRGIFMASDRLGQQPRLNRWLPCRWIDRPVNIEAKVAKHSDRRTRQVVHDRGNFERQQKVRRWDFSNVGTGEI